MGKLGCLMTLTKKQLKKLPYYLSLILLTMGASLILGFLSFGGMYALLPVLPLAAGAFILSVAYEYEIYRQNINGALNKIFKHRFLDRQVSNQFLLDNFPDIEAADCPQFFKDYQAQLKLLHRFEHKRLDKKSSKHKKQVEKTLKDMEKWFAVQFFAKNDSEVATPYERALHDWLKKNEAQTKDYRRRRTFLKGAFVFSSVTGLLMSFGSTFLLVEAFTAVPLLASIPFGVLPALIIPMAIVSGIAYGLLTYNAVTDMIANATLQKWARTLWNDFKTNGITPRNVFMAGLAVFLGALAVTLTVCTAGTWWTIAKHTRPLFHWMAKVPAFIMALIGADGIFFNLENTHASWNMIHDALKPSDHAHQHDKAEHKGGFFARVAGFFRALYQRENLLQILNPFRLLLVVTITPIRLVLFLGHLVSMGAGDDRVPGVPEIVGAFLSTVSEVFEDLHYFFDFVPGGHHHHGHSITDLLKERHNGHNHSHDNDLPTRCVKLLFSPVYLLATGWDFLASQFNSEPRSSLGFIRAWEKQHGIPLQETVEANPNEETKTSDEWKREHTMYRIERHKQKQLQGAWIGRDAANDKCDKLTTLQKELCDSTVPLYKRLSEEDKTPYQKHRFFFASGKTSTEEFVDGLAERVGASPV